MAFTVQDFHDLLQLLRERPDWREEMERALLGERLLSLPDIVRELAEAQRRTEVRVEELVEAQRRTEVRVEELVEAQRRTEVRVEELAEAQRRTEVRLEELVKQVQILSADSAWLKRDMADVKGELLELCYVERAPAYFASIVRRPRIISRTEWIGQIHDSEEKGIYTSTETGDLVALDLLARGRIRDDTEAYLAAGISWTIHIDDVERAARRADLLRRQYPLVIPVAAGKGFVPDAFSRAQELQVTLLVDGQPITPL